jgi:hypothetical protein
MGENIGRKFAQSGHPASAHAQNSVDNDRKKTCINHRNLSTRASMFALVQQTFLAKKNLVKSLLISTLDKVIYYKGTFLQGSTKPLFTTQNRLETS